MTELVSKHKSQILDIITRTKPSVSESSKELFDSNKRDKRQRGRERDE